MNIALWIVQVILGVMFLMAGSVKAFNYAKVQSTMTWAKGKSKGYVSFVGFSELLGGLGLILPGLTGIAPILTVYAAVGLAIIMILAAIVHIALKEYQAIFMNVVLLALSIFVAYGRFEVAPF